MRCPACSSLETKVVDSRMNQTSDIIRRRRQCLHCESRFTTYERVEEVMPAVVKKDERRETYDRTKLKAGIEKSCQKRSITSQQIEEIVSRIEKKVQSFGVKEIVSKTLGQMVMEELHRLDKVAYVRFASVYREFRDVDEFVTELQELDELQKENQPLMDPKSSDSSLTFPFIENESTNPR